MERCTRPRPTRRQQRRWNMVEADWSSACIPNSDLNGGRLLCNSFELPVPLPCFCFSGRLSLRTRSTTSRMKNRASLKSSRAGNSKARQPAAQQQRTQRQTQQPQQQRQQPAAAAQQTSSNSNSSSGPSRLSNSNRNSSSGSNRPSNSSAAATAAGPADLSSSGRNSSSNVPSRPGNNSNRSVRSSRQSRGNSSGDGNSRAAGRGIVHGSRIVLNGGKASIALGRSVEAMAVTTFLRPASVSISGVNTGSGCAASPRCTWGIRASRTAAFRSCSWIPGRNTGQENWYEHR